MGNSALKAHLETSQKTGVFQLTGKSLQEVNKQTKTINTKIITHYIKKRHHIDPRQLTADFLTSFFVL